MFAQRKGFSLGGFGDDTQGYKSFGFLISSYFYFGF